MEIRLYREGLAYLLRHRVKVVGTAATWEEAAPALAVLQPDIVLVDMATPWSFEAVREILALEPPAKVVALAVPNAEDELLACAEAGVSGYVTRDDSLETMVAAIDSVARGELLCTPRMAAALLQRIGTLTAATQPADAYRLTPREREIAELIDDGFSNKAIAEHLHIELPTVKNHVHNILDKLQVHRRGDAAARLRAARTTLKAGPIPSN
jgi:DNA-binding NarL/FixJ family response regulator